jgi:hypothetical protein
MTKKLTEIFKKTKEAKLKKVVIPKETKIIAPEIEADSEISANDVLAQIFKSNGSDKGMSDDDVKDIENIKLIIASILNDDLLESLTNLDPDELDDINDAMYLNEYADNPRLYIYILHRLKLSRSKVFEGKSNNLLTIFADISGKGLTNKMNEVTGSILGKRFG